MQRVLYSKELKDVEDIREETEKYWGSTESFFNKGFGFAYSLDNRIASWCTTDCVSEGRCEVGVETAEDLQKLGYSSKTVAVMLKHCKSIGIKKVGWHCWDNNVASYRLAEKLGFEKKKEIGVYFGWYNIGMNCLINGTYYLVKKSNYKRSSEFYVKAMENGYGRAEHYYNAAIEKGWKGIMSISQQNLEYYYHDKDACFIEQELMI